MGVARVPVPADTSAASAGPAAGQGRAGRLAEPSTIRQLYPTNWICIGRQFSGKSVPKFVPIALIIGIREQIGRAAAKMNVAKSGRRPNGRPAGPSEHCSVGGEPFGQLGWTMFIHLASGGRNKAARWPNHRPAGAESRGPARPKWWRPGRRVAAACRPERNNFVSAKKKRMAPGAECKLPWASMGRRRDATARRIDHSGFINSNAPPEEAAGAGSRRPRASSSSRGQVEKCA